MEPCPTVLPQQNPLKVAIAATFAVDALAEPLRIWAQDVVGLTVSVTWVGYGDALNALQQPDSVLNSNINGVNVLLVRLQDLAERRPDILEGSTGDGEDHVSMSRVATVLSDSVLSASMVCGQPWLVMVPPHSPEECECPKRNKILSDALQQFKTALSGRRNVYIFGPEEILQSSPWMIDSYYCSFLDRAAHAPYTGEFLSVLAGFLMRQFSRVLGPLRKVAVLDCDNTLWGGAVAELGPEGVLLTPAFVAVQRCFLRLQASGWLLCLCSRNLESDVLEVFEKRVGEMPLVLTKHVIGIKANWNPKSENVNALSRELSIGLENFVFIDDNIAECADVQLNCPGVAIMHVPSQQDLIQAFLQNSWILDLPLKAGSAGTCTKEDETRSEMYRAVMARQKEENSFATHDAFLASLNLRVSVEPLNGQNALRAAQLTQRTNQHNARKCELSESQMSALVDIGLEIYTFESSDRFGNHGLVGFVCIDGASFIAPPVPECKEKGGELLDLEPFECLQALPPGKHLRVRAWLLSCRALHLGIEYRMLQQIAGIARNRDMEWLAIDWVCAERNEPAAAFLFSLPGACFLPCAPPLLTEFITSQTRGYPNVSKQDDTHTRILSSRPDPSLSSAEEVIASIHAVIGRAVDLETPLLLSDLPAEENMNLLAPEARRDLSRQLLPLVGKLRAAEAGSYPPVQLVRGRVGGEQCRCDARKQPCPRRQHCPFRHIEYLNGTDFQNNVEIQSQSSYVAQSASLPMDREPGISVYQKRSRPPAGIIVVPVESALVAEVSFASKTSQQVISKEQDTSKQDDRLRNEKSLVRHAFLSSSGLALHNDTYNFLARTLADENAQKELHQWILMRQIRPSTMPQHYQKVWEQMHEEESRNPKGQDASRQHARLRRELRHAQHLMIQESNPNSYYSSVQHHQT